MGQSIREDVTSGDLNSLFEEIMLKNDEPRVPCCSVANDILPVLKDLLNSGKTTMDIEVYNIFSHTPLPLLSLGSPPVSKVATGLMRVHITGVSPIAIEIARTRSLIRRDEK